MHGAERGNVDGSAPPTDEIVVGVIPFSIWRRVRVPGVRGAGARHRRGDRRPRAAAQRARVVADRGGGADGDVAVGGGAARSRSVRSPHVDAGALRRRARHVGGLRRGGPPDGAAAMSTGTWPGQPEPPYRPDPAAPGVAAAARAADAGGRAGPPPHPSGDGAGRRPAPRPRPGAPRRGVRAARLRGDDADRGRADGLRRRVGRRRRAGHQQRRRPVADVLALLDVIAAMRAKVATRVPRSGHRQRRRAARRRHRRTTRRRQRHDLAARPARRPHRGAAGHAAGPARRPRAAPADRVVEALVRRTGSPPTSCAASSTTDHSSTPPAPPPWASSIPTADRGRPAAGDRQRPGYGRTVMTTDAFEISDDELTALAMAADPDAVVDEDAVPFGGDDDARRPPAGVVHASAARQRPGGRAGSCSPCSSARCSSSTAPACA